MSFTASESGYSGAFTATNTCSGIATVTPSSASGPSAAFTVTPTANGTCTVTINDASNNSTSVNVTISGVTFTIQ